MKFSDRIITAAPTAIPPNMLYNDWFLCQRCSKIPPMPKHNTLTLCISFFRISSMEHIPNIPSTEHIVTIPLSPYYSLFASYYLLLITCYLPFLYLIHLFPQEAFLFSHFPQGEWFPASSSKIRYTVRFNPLQERLLCTASPYSVTNTVLVSFFPMRHFSQSLYFAPESFRNPDTVSSGTARMLKSK